MGRNSWLRSSRVMEIQVLKLLRCPRCKKELKLAGPEENAKDGFMVCPKGHRWEILDGIPSLLYPPLKDEDMEWIAQYDEIADRYDELVKQYDEWLGINLMKERQNLAQFLPLHGPARVMDVSVGTGANLVAIRDADRNRFMQIEAHGLDVSWGMLNAAKRNALALDMRVNLTHGSVYNIPYKDGQFDLVIHTGGINTFSDISKAMEEMLRIAKKNAAIVIIDEGLSPEMRRTEKGKDIIAKNTLFAAKPPLEHLPDKARDIEVTYVMGDTFYQILFRK